MDILDEIIEDRLSQDVVRDLGYRHKITESEFMLLTACNEYIDTVMSFIGGDVYVIDIPNVSREEYFTNVGAMLNTFYSLYKKYPNYHFDKIFEQALLYGSQHLFDVYRVIVVLNFYLNDIELGVAPFKIDNMPAILNNCKQIVLNNIDRFKNYKRYEGRNYKNGAYDLFKEYDKNFISKIGVGILK